MRLRRTPTGTLSFTHIKHPFSKHLVGFFFCFKYVHLQPLCVTQKNMGNRVAREDFEWVYTDQPHADRRKEILGELALLQIVFG